MVLLFIQNDSQFKNMAKICFPPSIHRFKFIFDNARLVLFSSANILQIAAVALRVVFLLLLSCFQLFFRLVVTLETSEMSAIFKFTTKTTQPRPQVFSVNGALTCKNAAFFDIISSLNTTFFQIWSSVTGYGELNVCFQPIRIVGNILNE